MAINTSGTHLMYKVLVGDSYTKLVDIVNYPDMGSAPSKLDITDLSAVTFKTSILGLQEVPDLTFECNYDYTTYTTIAALTADGYFFQLQFGTDGVDGAYSWEGQISIFASGAGVDEVRKMQVTLSAATEIVPS